MEHPPRWGMKVRGLTVLTPASFLGVALVACTVVGLGIGLLLDRLLGTKPYLTLVFLLLGIAAGFIQIFRVAKP